MFVDALRTTVGADINVAWQALDPHGLGVVDCESFARGVAQLGFKGDADCIFCGLDTAGQGRMWHDEFAYLRKVMRSQDKQHFGEGAIPFFVRWVQNLGGMEALCELLGYDTWRPGPGLDPSKAEPVDIANFAAQLTRLGLDRQDAFAVSARAARLAGGGAVPLETVFIVAGEEPPEPLFCKRARSASASSSRFLRLWSQGEDLRAAPRPAWDDHLHLPSKYNAEVPAKARLYFTDPETRTVRNEQRQIVNQTLQATAWGRKGPSSRERNGRPGPDAWLRRPTQALTPRKKAKFKLAHFGVAQTEAEISAILESAGADDHDDEAAMFSTPSTTGEFSPRHSYPQWSGTGDGQSFGSPPSTSDSEAEAEPDVHSVIETLRMQQQGPGTTTTWSIPSGIASTAQSMAVTAGARHSLESGGASGHPPLPRRRDL